MKSRRKVEATVGNGHLIKPFCGIAMAMALAGCGQKPAAICAAETTLSTVSAIVAPAAQGTNTDATPRADVIARISYALIVVDEHDPKTGRVKCSATMKVDMAGVGDDSSPSSDEVRLEYTVQPDATGNGQVITVAPSLAPLILMSLASDLDQQPVATVSAQVTAPAPADPAETEIAGPPAARHAFEDYAAQPFAGPSRAPDFSGSEAEYADFRTRLRAAFDEGVNFGGAYSFAEIGCGTSCRFAYIINHKNGAISSFPLGGEENYRLTLKYMPDSTLVQASWENVDGDVRTCVYEDFNWTTREFQSLGRSESPGSCP